MLNTNFYQELAEYVGRDVNIVAEYSKIARVVLAYKWEEEKADPIKYYKESSDYIYDLSFYQDILQGQGFFMWIESVIKDFRIKSVLDFGGGIGQYSIIASINGLEANYVDVEGSKTEAYAKYRFNKYNVSPGILKLGDPLKDYDLVIAMDVFEHIADNAPVIDDVAKHCKYMICNTPEEMPYNFMYPQHISRVNLAPCFEQVSGRLWKSKYIKK
jgi:2-polyprenyl-3-methyl-5-hydroxy-6-metoxy-1,4-benzoquinol methylase